jgi:hypothetical protein
MVRGKFELTLIIGHKTEIVFHVCGMQTPSPGGFGDLERRSVAGLSLIKHTPALVNPLVALEDPCITG